VGGAVLYTDGAVLELVAALDDRATRHSNKPRANPRGIGPFSSAVPAEGWLLQNICHRNPLRSFK
jgi:hypothetical protein